MRMNKVKLIPLIDVDITSKYYGSVRIRIKPAAISNIGNIQTDVEVCLSTSETTQLIKMLKAQRDRIKTRKGT